MEINLLQFQHTVTKYSSDSVFLQCKYDFYTLPSKNKLSLYNSEEMR